MNLGKAMVIMGISELDGLKLTDLPQIFSNAKRELMKKDLPEDELEDMESDLSEAHMVIRDSLKAYVQSMNTGDSSILPDKIYPQFVTPEETIRMNATRVLEEQIKNGEAVFLCNDMELKVPFVIPKGSNNMDSVRIYWEGKTYVTQLQITKETVKNGRK